MDCPVTTQDVQDVFERPFTATDWTRCQSLLNDGWEQILTRVPGVVARYTSGVLRPGAVVAVLREAVSAVLRNPGGFLEESIEDWSGRRDAASSTGKLLLSDDDLAMLMPYTLNRSWSIVMAD